MKSYPQTDAGNAELFADLNEGKLCYDHSRGRWLIWQKNRWEEDQTDRVYLMAKRAARTRLRLADKIKEDDRRKQAIKWALESEGKYRLEACLALAQRESLIADPGTGWDSDAWLLGVTNGVVNLRTGRLLKAQTSHRITLYSPLAFDPSAECPRWIGFLDEVFCGDEQLVEFIQLAIGYSLTGFTNEQGMFLCHGEGANGKSTLLETLRYVLGEYAYNLPFSAFELQGRSSIPNDIAALPGRRFVTSIETNEAVRLNEARIKALTGCDTITARLLYHEPFQFTPVAKFWLAFNHRPRIQDDSHGFWRRVFLIPFNRKFTDRDRNQQLKETLRAEGPGILAWAVHGCLAWQQKGLEVPERVRAATAEYQEESDPVGEFIAERCILDPNATTLAARLWSEYQMWASEWGERVSIDRKGFSERLQTRGLRKVRKGHNRDWVWLGIRIEGDYTGGNTVDRRAGADMGSNTFPNSAPVIGRM